MVIVTWDRIVHGSEINQDTFSLAIAKIYCIRFGFSTYLVERISLREKSIPKNQKCLKLKKKRKQ